MPDRSSILLRHGMLCLVFLFAELFCASFESRHCSEAVACVRVCKRFTVQYMQVFSHTVVARDKVQLHLTCHAMLHKPRCRFYRLLRGRSFRCRPVYLVLLFLKVIRILADTSCPYLKMATIRCTEETQIIILVTQHMRSDEAGYILWPA